MVRSIASGFGLLFAALWALGTAGAATLPLVNSGFETGPFPGWPGYSTAIPGWTAAGSTGVNPEAGGGAPFLNGLAPPEGTHAAFIQGLGNLYQDVTGFEIGKQYYVAYFENERGALGDAVALVQVNLGGQAVVAAHNIRRTPQFRQVISSPFTATSTTHRIEVIHPGGGVADNSALFDDFIIATAGIQNFGFEEGPVNPWPGYGPIDQWTRSHPGGGNSGTNDAGGPFTNGLSIPQGSWIGFIQTNGVLSQMVGGFEVGRQYIVQFAENERGSGAAIARLEVRLGGQTIVAGHDVTRSAQWRTVVSDPFTPTTFAHLLEVIHPGGGTGDNTALFDNFLITRADLHVNNQSFEEGPLHAWPGYGPIQGWYGGSGNNDASGPFVNGLPIPDGTRVAFVQTSGTLKQTIVGLTPGKDYIVQYFENERGSGAAVARAEVRVDGAAVVAAHNVTRTPRFVNVAGAPFTAGGTSAVLEIIHPGGGVGDNTLLVDGVYVTEAGVPFVKNHNFEAAATFGGPGNYYSDIPGWLDPVGVPAGVALPSPHHTATWLDGAVVPEGNQVGFIQNGGSIQQLAVGLVPGKQYIVQLFENARGAANPAQLQVNLDGQTVVANHAVGKTAQFRTVVGAPFTATSTAHSLEIIHPGGGVGDNTVLFDQVLITEAGVPFVKNPGFEEFPLESWPGYGRVSSWNSTGTGPGPGPGPGTNGAGGPFLNGLPIPEGQNVGFIQGTGSLSQTVVGLVPGQQYVLQYYQDERGDGANPVAGPSAVVDGNTVVSQTELIRTPQFRRVVSKPFTASGIAAVLELRNTGIQGDNSLLLDNVAVRKVGTVLLQDNFDLRNDPAAPHVPVGDYDINAGLAGRHAGMFAGTRYVETAHSASGGPGDLASQVDMASAPDALMLGANAGLGAAFTAVSPNVDFGLRGLDVRHTTFEFDVDPYMPGSGAGDNWASFRFGDTAPVQYVNAPGGIGILFRDSGAYEAFDGSTYLGSGTAFTGQGFHAIRIEVDALAFDGSPAAIAAFADGSETPFFTYTKAGGFLGNYITLGGSSGSSDNMLHGFDNLMVTVEHVPEPASWALLALGAAALAAAGRRRRRAQERGA